MDQNKRNRFFSMADIYDRMAPVLVPKYSFLQDELINLILAKNKQPDIVVDLGAGSGRLLEKVLNRFPGAIGYWIDFSEDFHRVAQQRLMSYGDRVKFILSPLEGDWEANMGEQADLFISMSAIHHLEPLEKKKLTQKCFDYLNIGGWFFNVDEMKTLTEEAYKNSLDVWVRYVDNIKKDLPKEQMSFYNEWKFHFDNWKKRNVDNFDQPKSKGDDIHDSFIDQLSWLQESGFQHVDLFIKYYLWSVIGGQKS